MIDYLLLEDDSDTLTFCVNAAYGPDKVLKELFGLYEDMVDDADWSIDNQGFSFFGYRSNIQDSVKFDRATNVIGFGLDAFIEYEIKGDHGFLGEYHDRIVSSDLLGEPSMTTKILGQMNHYIAEPVTRGISQGVAFSAMHEALTWGVAAVTDTVAFMYGSFIPYAGRILYDVAGVVGLNHLRNSLKDSFQMEDKIANFVPKWLRWQADEVKRFSEDAYTNPVSRLVESSCAIAAAVGSKILMRDFTRYVGGDFLYEHEMPIDLLEPLSDPGSGTFYDTYRA